MALQLVEVLEQVQATDSPLPYEEAASALLSVHAAYPPYPTSSAEAPAGSAADGAAETPPGPGGAPSEQLRFEKACLKWSSTVEEEGAYVLGDPRFHAPLARAAWAREDPQGAIRHQVLAEEPRELSAAIYGCGASRGEIDAMVLRSLCQVCMCACACVRVCGRGLITGPVSHVSLLTDPAHVSCCLHLHVCDAIAGNHHTGGVAVPNGANGANGGGCDGGGHGDDDDGACPQFVAVQNLRDGIVFLDSCKLKAEANGSKLSATFEFCSVLVEICQYDAADLFQVHFHSTSLHFIPLHFPSFHFTSLHSTSLHFIPLHFTSLHSTSLHFHSTSLHFTSLHSTLLHFHSFARSFLLFRLLSVLAVRVRV